MSAGATGPKAEGKAPLLVWVEGSERRQFRLPKVPYCVGRRVDKDLVLSDSRCSRDHASILLEADGYYLKDEGSKLGTFANGERIQRKRLEKGDRIEFGVRGGAYLLFEPEEAANEASQFLSRMSGWMPAAGATEFSTLNLLLEAARKLNSSTVLAEVLGTLIETSLRLTRAERGLVFLRDKEGKFRLAAGRNARGDPIVDDDTISHSTLDEAASTGCEFVVTDVDDMEKLAGRRSVENYGLCSVICIPLRRVGLSEEPTSAKNGQMWGTKKQEAEIRGVLYLDSHSLAGRLTAVRQDILRTLATEAATLVENASLVQARESARRYEQEMEIAAQIQQRLLSAKIPEVAYAEVRARSLPCLAVGGDFFEVVRTKDAITAVVADVCGKGVSAALLASVLQGLIYSLLARSATLEETAEIVHGFLCEKEIGEKYATMLLARLEPDGALEVLSCGHVPPLVISEAGATELEGGSPPVGLLPEVSFQSVRQQMRAGERLMVVTDGVTEAQNAAGDFFGMERMNRERSLQELMEAVRTFAGSRPLEDDCTALEMVYRGLGNCRIG